MKAAISDQRSILDLQKLDFLTTSLRNKLETLPELAEINSLTIKQNNARDLRVAAETELSDVKRELSRAEADVEQIVGRIERDEKRLASGSGTPKELEQMQHELISLNARRSELEEIELEVMLRADGIKTRINELKAKEEALAIRVAEAAVAKDAALSAIDLEMKSAVAAREELIPQIEKALIDLYEKIRSGGVVAAARLSGNQCGGCNLAINAGDLSKLMALPEEEIARCEECRCILVRK